MPFRARCWSIVVLSLGLSLLIGGRAAGQSAFVDQDSYSYFHMRPAAIWTIDLAAKLREVFPEHARQAEDVFESMFIFPPADIEGVTIALNASPAYGGTRPKMADFEFKEVDGKLQKIKREVPWKVLDRESMMYLHREAKIIKTVKPYDKTKLMKRFLDEEALERKVKGKSYFISRRSYPDAIHFIDERTIVIASPAAWMEKLLEAPPTKPGPLGAAINLAEKKQHHLVFGFNFEHLFAKVDKQIMGERWESPSSHEPTWTLIPLLSASSATLTFDLGKDSKVQGEMTFPTADKAERALGAADDAIALIRILALGQTQKELHRAIQEQEKKEDMVFLSLFLRQMEDALRGVKVTRDQNTLRASAAGRFDVDAIRAGVKAELLVLAGAESYRHARIRRASVDNLKIIGLALHSFHDSNKALPSAAICSKKDGKPLLSWRVMILPNIGEAKLFFAFHHDEPWDSPHNIKLLAQMPNVYLPAGVKTKEPYSTYYRAIVGPEAVFELRPDADQPFGVALSTSLKGITDGASHTFGVAEARDAVPWTKPDELMYDAQKPLPAMGGSIALDGFNAVFMDATVRFISTRVSEKSIRAGITRAGNDPSILQDPAIP